MFFWKNSIILFTYVSWNPIVRKGFAFFFFHSFIHFYWYRFVISHFITLVIFLKKFCLLILERRRGGEMCMYVYIYICIYIYIFRERERERERERIYIIDLLFHLFMHSLLASYMYPTRDRTYSLEISGWHSHQMSYSVRAKVLLLL